MKQFNAFIIVTVLGLIAAGVAVVRLSDEPTKTQVVADSPLLVPIKATSATTAPPATAAGGQVVRTPKPKAIPKDPYAVETIQEIGTIEIPKIGLTHRLYHGITLRNIDLGPSHWPGTALPGETGNTVIAGHRVTHSHPFRDIHKLVPGDEVFFTVAGHRTRYIVTGHEIVSPKALHIADPTPTATGTLFACHPPGSARQRYVVRLQLT